MDITKISSTRFSKEFNKLLSENNFSKASRMLSTALSRGSGHAKTEGIVLHGLDKINGNKNKKHALNTILNRFKKRERALKNILHNKNKESQPSITDAGYNIKPDDYIDFSHGGGERMIKKMIERKHGYGLVGDRKKGMQVSPLNNVGSGLGSSDSVVNMHSNIYSRRGMLYGDEPAILKGKIKAKYVLKGRRDSEAQIPDKYFDKIKDYSIERVDAPLTSVKGGKTAKRYIDLLNKKNKDL